MTQNFRFPSFQFRIPGVHLEQIPRKKLNIKKRVFVVQEVGEAECIGVEGDLPIEAQTGEVYKFADASSQDGQFTLGIEYDQKPPTVFIGRWLKYTDLVLDDEGLEW